MKRDPWAFLTCRLQVMGSRQAGESGVAMGLASGPCFHTSHFPLGDLGPFFSPAFHLPGVYDGPFHLSSLGMCVYVVVWQ